MQILRCDDRPSVTLESLNLSAKIQNKEVISALPLVAWDEWTRSFVSYFCDDERATVLWHYMERVFVHFVENCSDKWKSAQRLKADRPSLPW